MSAFEAQRQEYIRCIEATLTNSLPKTDCRQKRVIEAMAYSLLDGGKRVRGTLVLAFYRLFAPQAELDDAAAFAAAVEMVHAYSLVHDDLPCMDDDDTRRGKPSCHIAFDEATAVLAGDALLTLAFETVLDPSVTGLVGAERAARAAATLARAAGACGMVGGQMMDLQNENREISAETLRETDRKKTGALFTACAVMGCILADAPPDDIKHARAWADAVGLAYQIVDDLLDADADPELLGKPVGSDARQGKTTYIDLYGPERSAEIARQLSADACGELDAIGGDSAFLRQMTQMMLARRS